MNLDIDKLLKLAQNLSFTTFLILCVGAMSYAMFHLYTDNRSDWNQVQLNAQNIGQMNQNVNLLVGKIDQLLDELHVCLRGASVPAALNAPRPLLNAPGALPTAALAPIRPGGS